MTPTGRLGVLMGDGKHGGEYMGLPTLRPSTKLAEAIGYSLNRRAELTRFLDGGRIATRHGPLGHTMTLPQGPSTVVVETAVYRSPRYRDLAPLRMHVSTAL